MYSRLIKIFKCIFSHFKYKPLVFPYASSPNTTGGKNVMNVCKRDFLLLAVGRIS